MTQDILFSVLVPVYNVEKYLHQCIESVLNQSYQNFELILVNDGSTDSSGAICDDYAAKDDRINVIHKQNAGHTAARFDAANASSGEYLAFLDSDDWWDLTLLEKARDAIQKNKCEIVLFNYFRACDDCVTILTSNLFSNDILSGEDMKDLYKIFLTSGMLSGLNCKIIKRVLFDANDKSYLKMKFFEDFVASALLFDKAKTIYYVNEPLYYYRLTPNSITNTFSHLYFNDTLQMFDCADRFIEKNNINISEYEADIMRFRLNAIIRFTLNSLRTKSYSKKVLNGFLDSNSCRRIFQYALKNRSARKTINPILFALIKSRHFFLLKFLLSLSGKLKSLKKDNKK